MLSGVKPTGAPHLGNYFGAMKQFVDLQNLGHDFFAFVANLHALISVQNKDELHRATLDLVKDYLAIGLDPEKVTIFLQSDVPQHTELNWIFNCLVTVPYMERSHAYKDALQNGKEATVGLFDYPVLMAADILLYSPDIVPVGQDQKQHIEYARDIAGKFNFTFGQGEDTFKLPGELIPKDVAIVPGLDGRKMSKSYKNHIPLFASDEEIRKLCMRIVTDSRSPSEKKDPETCNVFALHKLVTPKHELDDIRLRYLNEGKGEMKSISYKESKELLAESIISFITPMREKRDKITDEQVLEVVTEGAKKALKIAEEKMTEVRAKTGLIRNI